MKPLFFLVLLLTIVTACKKDDIKGEDFDPTHYYVAGKFGSQNYGYAFTLIQGGTAALYSVSGIPREFGWKFSDNHLIFSTGENDKVDFTIVAARITNVSCTGEFTSSKSLFEQCTLQEIPPADSFSGKTFHIDVNGEPAVFRFGSNKDLVITFSGNSRGSTYSLINNAIGQTKGIGDLCFFLIDGELVL